MDNLLQNARDTMKERGLNDVKLPDQNPGVALYNGRLEIKKKRNVTLCYEKAQKKNSNV